MTSAAERSARRLANAVPLGESPSRATGPGLRQRFERPSRGCYGRVTVAGTSATPECGLKSGIIACQAGSVRYRDIADRPPRPAPRAPRRRAPATGRPRRLPVASHYGAGVISPSTICEGTGCGITILSPTAILFGFVILGLTSRIWSIVTP